MRRGLPDDVNPDNEPHSLYEGVNYEEYWFGREKQNLDKLEHVMVRKLLKNSGRRIVDLGSGYGRLADCYLDRFSEVFLVDGSISLLQQAQKMTKGGAVLIASDIRRLPFRDASFEAALMVRVFHHIDDSQRCLAEVNRILSRNGQFLFNFCNKQNLERVFHWLVGEKSRNPFSLSSDNPGSTFISHHPKAVRKTLVETGFEKINYYGVGVLDKLPVTGLTVLSQKLSPFFAWTKIAPWFFCMATTTGNKSLIEHTSISDLLQCPACRGNLIDQESGYRCLTCGKLFPIVNGILDFRVSAF